MLKMMIIAIMIIMTLITIVIIVTGRDYSFLSKPMCVKVEERSRDYASLLRQSHHPQPPFRSSAVADTCNHLHPSNGKTG